MSVGQQPATGDGDSGDERDFPLSDAPLLDLLDALVNDRGRVAAAEALGVNYRTMMACYDSRRVSRRMRQALVELRESGGVATEMGWLMLIMRPNPWSNGWQLWRRKAGGLRGLVETQAGQLEEVGRRVAQLEEAQQRGEPGTAAEAGEPSAWRPPRRGHGLPDAGVATLELQPDEEYAFGPAAPLVAEWRSLRTGDETQGSRVDRAGAGVRRWELEVELLREFHLTLPPETESLDDARRADHLRWRMDALENAQRELGKAERLRLLRRVVTLGVLWK